MIRSALALAAIILTTPVAAQTTIDVSLAEARSLATQALFSGDTGAALEIARAIVSQAPDDRAAWLIIAAAAPQQGAGGEGRIAGARGYALSQSDVERYEAARLTALAAANEQRFTLAILWLRRALTVAPNSDERAQTIADARFLQQQTPWSFEVSASLAPSSNVNGGASDDVASAPGNPTGTLSDDALALAGWRGSLGFGTSFRLQENPTSRTLIGAQYQLARIRITDDVDVPDEALSTDIAELSLQHDRLLNTGSIGVRLSYTMINYRNLDSFTLQTETQKYDVWRVGIDRRLPLGDSAELGFSFGRSWTEYEIAGIGQIVRSTFATSVAYNLPSNDQVRATLSYGNSDSENANYISSDWTAQISYAWAAPVGPISLDVGGGVTWSDYPEYRLLLPVEGGRQDTTLFYGINIGVPDVSYAGFTPALTVSGSSTDSNVSRFTRDALSVGLSISSQF